MVIAALTAAALAACGGSEEAPWGDSSASDTVVVEKEVIKEVQVPGETVVVEKVVTREVVVEKEVLKEVMMPAAPAAAGIPGPAGSPGPEPESLAIPDLDQIRAQLVTQQRIIVRTVDMALVVDDIQGAIDSVADVAVDAGGWVVSSDRSFKAPGFRQHQGALQPFGRRDWAAQGACQ